MADNTAFLGDKPTALTEAGGFVIGVETGGNVRLYPIGTGDDIDNDVMAKIASIHAVKQAIDALYDTLTVQIEGAASGILAFKTWAQLSSVTGTTGGQQAKVTEDNSSHTDPVTGQTVDNAGAYSWSVSPAGWEWTSPNLDGNALFALQQEVSAARSPQLTLKAKLDALIEIIGAKATAAQGGLAESAIQPNTLLANLEGLWATLPTTPPAQPGKAYQNGEVIGFTS